MAAEVFERKKLFLEMFNKSLGNVSLAANAANVDRKTVYNWLANDPSFSTKFDEVREVKVDFVENELLKNIKAGNVTAQIFFLKCQGKSRGYIERVEYTGPDGDPISVSMERGDMPDDALLSVMQTLAKIDPGLLAAINPQRAPAKTAKAAGKKAPKK